MHLDWHREYLELTNFITRNPEIRISTSVLRIPSEHSSKFYSLHKKIREAFIVEKAPDLLEKSNILSSNYIKVEEDVIRLFKIKDVYVAPSLRRFLHDPTNQLIQEIYNPLFDLLKGQINTEQYEEIALQNIKTFFKSLYQSGYEKWVILTLVTLLEADKIYKVVPEEVTEDDSFRHGGIVDYKIPDPEESASILFNRDVEVGFMVPDIIIHSANIDRYFSFTSEIIKAWAIGNNPSKRREWLPGDTSVVFEGGIILVYFDKNLNDLSLVTDMKRTCRADLIIECRVQKDWFEKKDLEMIKFHINKYKPKLGTYIVTIESIPEQVKLDIISEKSVDKIATGEDQKESGEQKPTINMITVGFNQNNLEPIVDILRQNNIQD